MNPRTAGAQPLARHSTKPVLASRTPAPMADHAVFLVHGLWGNKAHFWFVEQQLRVTHPSIKIHACSVNEGNKTYDGIDVGGDRVVAEVLPALETC